MADSPSMSEEQPTPSSEENPPALPHLCQPTECDTISDVPSLSNESPNQTPEEERTSLKALLGDKYSIPTWSGRCELGKCYFEVMKSGVIVETIDLTTKECYLVGRQPGIDIPMEHPSVSRLHAVIQMRSTGQVYVYDLGSTHGTFWNKANRINSGIHVPVKVGDMLRFGQSSRHFILAGDIYDRDEVEEKKDQLQEQKKAEALRKRRQDQTIRLLEERQLMKKSQEVAVQESLRGEGCGWGMKMGPISDDEMVVTAVTADMQDTQFDDDDEFYDRTGAVKKKEARRAKTEVIRDYDKSGNQVRVKILRKSDNETTLSDKLNQLRAELTQLDERMVSIASNAAIVAEGERDDLDDFIQQSRAQEALESKRKLEIEAAKLRKEITHTEKLLALVRPAGHSADDAAPPAVSAPTPTNSGVSSVPSTLGQSVFSITKEQWEEEYRAKRTQERAAREEHRRETLERIRQANLEAKLALKKEFEEEHEEEEEEQQRQVTSSHSTQGPSSSAHQEEEEETHDPKAAAVEAKLQRNTKAVSKPQRGTLSGLETLISHAAAHLTDEDLDGQIITVPLDEDDDDGDTELSHQAKAARQKREKTALLEMERTRKSDEQAKAFVDSFGENQDKASKRRRMGLDPSAEEKKAKKRATFQGTPTADAEAKAPKAAAAVSSAAPANPKAAFRAVQKAMAQKGPARPPQPKAKASEGSVTSDANTPHVPDHKPLKGPSTDWWKGEATGTEWAPPTDQTGDGRTHLNERYGY